MKPLQIQKFLFKNVIFFDHRERNVPHLKCLQKPRSFGWFKTSQALRSVVYKTRLNSSKDNFIAKSFGLSTKRKLSSLLNFLFPFVSFFDWRIFSLEMQNFSLENHHIMNARQPFCWWMTFTKVSNPFLPSPPKWLTWPLDVCGGVGYGWLYWFGLYGRTFSQTSLELEILSSTCNGVTYVMSDIFFSAGYFSPRNLFACFFPLEISLQDIFWNHP